jgi:plastocyanin
MQADGRYGGMSKAAATALVLIILISVSGAVAIAQVMTTARAVNNASTSPLSGSPNTNVSNTITTIVTISPSNLPGEINRAPTVVPVKIEWCNNDNAGQDRFCANSIQVVQGDIVQVLFIQNDTDAHTFTLTSGLYDFQINDTVRGLANFLNNKAPIGSCINGNYNQESAGVSKSYCVSGSSLLSPSYLVSHGASGYVAEQNPNPTLPFNSSSNPHPITLPVSNKVYYGSSSNLSGVSISSNATGTEIWGIGAFRASFAGVFEFTCLYHVANGMFGYMTVLPNAYCNTNPISCGLNSTAVPSSAEGGNGSQKSGNNRSGSAMVHIQNGSSANTSLNGFFPQKLTLVIGVNNSVYWVNDDYSVHTVTANDGSFDSGFIQPGGNFTYTFTTPGTYRYHCSVHVWMTGTVVILPGS